MDMNPLSQVIELLAVFRRQIEESDFMQLALDTTAIDEAVTHQRLGIRFDIEGAKCCQGNPDLVYLLYDLGVRQMHFAYNRNNELGGGCHDEPTGLTPLGKCF
ncbi:MAG: dipeptidase, partial [Gammaproteobacteria bacterium]